MAGRKIGHKVSQETREKIRQTLLGKKQSKSTIEKRSKTMTQLYKSNPKEKEKRRIGVKNNLPSTAWKKGQKAWNKGLHPEYMQGENHPQFNNWSSRQPYGKVFSPELKESIRKRDSYRCQECFRHQSELKRKLDVHHIDFNKKNNHPNNLISLCSSCHMQTNWGRDKWTSYYQQRIKEKVIG